MNLLNFQNLLNKHKSTAESLLSNDFDNKIFGKKFYYTKSNENKYFKGIPYNIISLRIDEKDFVQSLTLHSNKLLTSNMYKSLIEEYGRPDSIQIIDTTKIKEIKSSVSSNFKQELKKVEFKTRDGSFEDKPIFILWNKQNYQLKLFFRYELNKCEITFRIPSNQF